VRSLIGTDPAPQLQGIVGERPPAHLRPLALKLVRGHSASERSSIIKHIHPWPCLRRPSMQGGYARLHEADWCRAAMRNFTQSISAARRCTRSRSQSVQAGDARLDEVDHLRFEVGAVELIDLLHAGRAGHVHFGQEVADDI